MSIPIPQLPTIKHASPFFRDGFLSMVIIGKSGCGKTRMLASILPGISKSIETIVIATAVRGVPLHEAIRDYFTAKGVFTGISYDPGEMMAFVTMCERIGKVTLVKQGLIIFDDFNVGRATGRYWDFVIHAFTKLRNTGWNFILISQQPSFVPTVVRNCTTARVLFDCYSKTALQSFTRDVSDRIPDRGAWDFLIDYLQTVPFSYAMIQEHPFEVSAGKLNDAKVVMNSRQVMIPTLDELKREMNVDSIQQLRSKSAMLQAKAGNTSEMLGY